MLKVNKDEFNLYMSWLFLDIRNMITDYLAAGDQTKSAKTSLFGKNKYTDLEQMQFYMVPMI